MVRIACLPATRLSLIHILTDEFIKPINNTKVDGTIQEGDVVIFINYRNDRAKELTQVLTQQDMPEAVSYTHLL